jgi:hypothetical protein
MRKTLLGSVAALALIASTGLAPAQSSGAGTKGGEAPAAGQARGDSGAISAQPSAKGTSAETSTAPATKNGAGTSERGDTKGAKPGGDVKADSAPKASGDMKAESAPKASGDMKADSASKPAAAATTPAPAASKDAKNPTEDNKPAGPDNKTTGNAATSATAAPPAEKRSQITTAIKQEKVEEVTNVNFNIAVGTTVPASVRYHPLPSRIVEIYPEWRGYDFIVVRGQYIILRPQTHEIVYIIEG